MYTAGGICTQPGGIYVHSRGHIRTQSGVCMYTTGGRYVHSRGVYMYTAGRISCKTYRSNTATPPGTKDPKQKVTKVLVRVTLVGFPKQAYTFCPKRKPIESGGLEAQGQAGPAGRQAGLARWPPKAVAI